MKKVFKDGIVIECINNEGKSLDEINNEMNKVHDQISKDLLSPLIPNKLYEAKFTVKQPKEKVFTVIIKQIYNPNNKSIRTSEFVNGEEEDINPYKTIFVPSNLKIFYTVDDFVDFWTEYLKNKYDGTIIPVESSEEKLQEELKFYDSKDSSYDDLNVTLGTQLAKKYLNYFDGKNEKDLVSLINKEEKQYKPFEWFKNYVFPQLKKLFKNEKKICCDSDEFLEEKCKEINDLIAGRCLELENGNYYYVEAHVENGQLLLSAGGATNVGMFYDYTIIYDLDCDLDCNLENLYYEIIESEEE